MFSEASVSHSVHREVRVSLIPCPFRGYGRVIYGPISRRGVCIWGPGGRVSGRGWVFGDGYTLSPAPPETTKAGGMHPTGMYSCCFLRMVPSPKSTITIVIELSQVIYGDDWRTCNFSTSREPGTQYVQSIRVFAL